MIHKQIVLKEGELDSNNVFIFKGRTSLDYNIEIVGKQVREKLYTLDKERKSIKAVGGDESKIKEEMKQTRKLLIKEEEILLSKIIISLISQDNVVKVNNKVPTLQQLIDKLEEAGYRIKMAPLKKIEQMLTRLKEFRIIDFSVIDSKLKYLQISPFIAWAGSPDETRDKLLSKILEEGDNHIFSKYPVSTSESIIPYIKSKAWIINYYIDEVFDEYYIKGKKVKYGTKIILSHTHDRVYNGSMDSLFVEKSKISINYAEIDITREGLCLSWTDPTGMVYPAYTIIDYLFPQWEMSDYKEKVSNDCDDIMSDSVYEVFSLKQASFKTFVI